MKNPTPTHRRAILGLLNDIERAIQHTVMVLKEDAGHLLKKRQEVRARLAKAHR